MDKSRLLTIESAFIRVIENFGDVLGNLKYEQALFEIPIYGLRSLLIDFNDLYSFDSNLAREVLENPDGFLPQFNSAVFHKLQLIDREYAQKIRGTCVKIKGLPTETPLYAIGSMHIGKFVMINGIIVRMTSVSPLLIKASFSCKVCVKKARIFCNTPCTLFSIYELCLTRDYDIPFCVEVCCIC